MYTTQGMSGYQPTQIACSDTRKNVQVIKLKCVPHDVFDLDTLLTQLVDFHIGVPLRDSRERINLFFP